MEETNLKSVAEKRKEFLNYLSNVVNNNEGMENSKRVRSHNNAQSGLANKPCNIQKKETITIKVYDKKKKKKKPFKMPKEITIALMGFIRNSKSLSDLYFESEWSVFRWIQQWLLHQNQPDLQPNLLLGLIEAACMLDAPLLLTTCLQFWRGNVRYVMKDGEWELLNENVITQFANLFDNCLLEDLTQNGLQEMIFQKFITFLNEPQPRESIGHYATLYTLWKCKFCGKLVNEETKSSECQFVAVDPNGDVGWAHSCDPDWSLSGLLTKLQGKRKQWRLVYWALWTYCHFLFCTQCLQWFSISEIKRCRHHLKITSENKFSCCGKPNNRYEPLSRNSGCLYQMHTPVLNSTKERNIFKIYHFLDNLNVLPKRSQTTTIESISMLPTQYRDNERNLVNGKHLYSVQRTKEHRRKIKKSGWWKHGTTSWNQDNQREQEEQAIREIQKLLSGKSEHKPSLQFHGGSYVNVEAEWWNNLRRKMRNITQE